MKILYKVIKDNSYQIVHIHQNSASMAMDALIAKRCGVKTIIGHSHNTSCNVLWQHYLLRPIVNHLLDYRFGCSEEAGQWIFGTKKCSIIHNAVDLQTYQYSDKIRRDYRGEYDFKKNLVIGFIGRLHPQKNCFRLLDIFKTLVEKVEANLVMIGDGEDRDNLKRYAEKIGIIDRVLFLGKREDVSRWMSVMDIFLLPSLYEGLPVVIVEAQANGLPIVTSTNVPAPDIIGCMKKISLEFSNKVWAEEILSVPRKENRQDVKKQFVKAGYDIETEARKLQKFYELSI